MNQNPLELKITGSIYRIFDSVAIKDTLNKKEIIVKVVNGQYEDYLKLETVNDTTIGYIEKFSEGEEVFVVCRAQGRLFDDKRSPGKKTCFTSLRLIRIEKPAILS